jgi:hypothetical protein
MSDLREHVYYKTYVKLNKMYRTHQGNSNAAEDLRCQLDDEWLEIPDDRRMEMNKLLKEDFGMPYQQEIIGELELRMEVLEAQAAGGDHEASANLVDVMEALNKIKEMWKLK